jgi:undecaprenyl-diphosphatase
MLEASIAGLTGLLINQLIGLAWTHPRPFVMGLGHTLISHVADSSFPSDHLTLWWSVAFSFMFNEGTRHFGILAGLIGIPMAWARIYLGAHFPLDMLGALCVSSSEAGLIHHIAGPVITDALTALLPLYHRLMGPLIRRG